ncbi:HNH endonuclease [Pseudomonas sp. EA_65y_Pfl2_P74]|uniref:HNH endonuclease n=1 Tax=Pseudomonas sp. EA_65y_Pfl2_P74 TaxID=3088694 RepID=UPI0030DA33EE
MKPIVFNGDDSAYISTYDGLNHKIWNETTGPIVSLRASVRKHYLDQQGYKCAYCRMLKRENHGLSWDVEHIVPKSEHPRFLFEPENLALACKECNLSKLDQKVFARPLRKNALYPRGKEHYTIIHPHYDKYEDHMEIAGFGGKVIYIPKNKGKGKETFIMCDLLRFSYDYGDWKDFSYAITKEVSEFVNRCPADATSKDISRFLSTLNFTINPDFAEHSIR